MISASPSYASLPPSLLITCLFSVLPVCIIKRIAQRGPSASITELFLLPTTFFTLCVDERQALHSIMKDLVALQMTRRQPSYDTGKPKTPGLAPSPGPAPTKAKRQVQRPIRLCCSAVVRFFVVFSLFPLFIDLLIYHLLIDKNHWESLTTA